MLHAWAAPKHDVCESELLRVLNLALYPAADAENAVSDAADSLKSGANDAKKGVKRNL